METQNLFAAEDDARASEPLQLGAGTWLLQGFVLPRAQALLEALDTVVSAAPLRHMETPGGFTMSVAMSNCGELGWISDRQGYRYSPVDPHSGQPWPAMPDFLRALAREAAATAGFDGFRPDACLVNRYLPGTRLTLHHDHDERDFSAPIVSVSLGMEATFLLGGLRRADKPQRVPLRHGDVLVWGGVDRLRFHGVAPLRDRPHGLLGRQRFNLTLRKAA